MKKIIALTGGISTGKSLVTQMFEKENFFIIDCDKIVNNMYKDKNILNKINRHFNDDYKLSSGHFNKLKLRNDVFSNKQIRIELNALIHPLVLKEIEDLKLSTKKNILIDMPLLFEINYKKYDKIVCVYTNKKIQLERLMNRDKIDENEALRKINSQMDIEKKKFLSDFVIDNSDNIITTKKQFLSILKQIKEN